MNSVSVYTKIPNLLKELRFILPNIQFFEALSEKDDKLKNSEIIIGDFDLLEPILYALPKTKWFQGTWAGVDKIINSLDKNKELPFMITRFSGQHFGRMMSEYVISSIINHERDYIGTVNNQKAKKWCQEGKFLNYRIISDLNVGILGLGHIGSWIGEILHKFGANIFGYGQKQNLSDNVRKFVKEYHTKPTLVNFLKNCDYIINVLPSTNDTKGLLNNSILQNCKDGAVFVNVGRGSIIDDDELIEALNKQWLSAAILDVFNIEPLPESSLLWSMPQVKITPHVSAVSTARHIAEQFKENYELYKSNTPIPTALDISKGY